MDSAFSLGCGCGTTVIDSKGTAMVFAIMMSYTYCGSSGTRRVNYKKAKKLFDFICANVNLPEVRPDCMGIADTIIRVASEVINPKKKEVVDG